MSLAQKQTIPSASGNRVLANLRAKYPQYGDVDDATLIQRIVAKYPEYADALRTEPAPTKHPSILTKQFGRELGRTLTTPEGYLNISKTALDVSAAPFAVADWALRNPVVNVQYPWAEPLAKAAVFPFQKIGEAIAGTLPENASPLARKINEINQGLAQFAAGAAVGGVAGEIRPRGLPKVAPKIMPKVESVIPPAETGGGQPPKTGLVVAYIGADNKIYYGEPTDIHFGVISKYPEAIPPKAVGFADPTGRFLNRKEALAYAETHKNIKVPENMPGQLDMKAYQEGKPVSPIGEQAKPPKMITGRGLKEADVKPEYDPATLSPETLKNFETLIDEVGMNLKVVGPDGTPLSKTSIAGAIQDWKGGTDAVFSWRAQALFKSLDEAFKSGVVELRPALGTPHIQVELANLLRERGPRALKPSEPAYEVKPGEQANIFKGRGEPAYQAKVPMGAQQRETIGTEGTPLFEKPKPKEPTLFGSGLGQIYPTLERGVREFMGWIPEKLPELGRQITPDIIKQVTSALKDAKMLRGETEKLYHEAKQKQVGVLAKIQKAELGEAGYYQELNALEGRLPRPEFESIRGRLPQEARDAMHRAVQGSERIGPWEKVVGGRALEKLFDKSGVEIPTEGEIGILEDVFGKGLAETLARKSSLSRKLKRMAIDVLALPQTLLASFDQSMVLRQAVIQSFRHPVKAFQGIGKSTKAMFSETAYREIRDKIAKDPDAKLGKEFGLYILDPDRAIVKLEQLEERFTSRSARYIPGVRASERAAYTYLNKIRLDVFKDYKSKLDRLGIDPTERPDLYKWTTWWVNTTTGRGSYGSWNRHAPTASLLIWSPRLLKRTIDLLRPKTYIKMPKELRVKAWGDLAAFVGPTLSLVALAKISGFADVSFDNRSSDFLKLRIGNTRIDPWGGFQQLLVFLSRIATGERTDTKGKVIDISGTGRQFPFESRLDIAYRFGESKANPTIGILLDFLRGRGFTGEDLTIAGEAYSHLIPLYLQDIYDAMKTEGPAMGLMTAPGFFGYGIQTYEAKPDKTLGRKVGTSLGKKIGTPIGR